MKKCPKCGCQLAPKGDDGLDADLVDAGDAGEDDEGVAMDEALADLESVLDDGLATKIPGIGGGGKPKAITLEVVTAKPRRRDDEDLG